MDVGHQLHVPEICFNPTMNRFIAILEKVSVSTMPSWEYILTNRFVGNNCVGGLSMKKLKRAVGNYVTGEKFRITPEHRRATDAFMSWIRDNSLRHKGKIRIVIMRKPKKAIKKITDYFINAVAAGYADKATRILDQHPDIQVLEPLVVGLKIFAAEEFRTAQEIK